MRIRTAALLCSALALSCSTIDTRTDDGYEGARTYSGTREALGLAKIAFLQVNPPFFALWVGDSVLSAVADTLLLPITIPEQSKLNRETAESLRTDVERPGVLPKIEGEEAVRTARRLFRECSGFVLNLDPRVTDCYSIGAKIQIAEGAEELTGAQYKLRLRQEFAPLRGTGRFMRFKDAQFEEQPPNIVITAVKEDSNDATRSPLTWIVGPGPDGQWRILEQRGASFP
jgi:hypothetical protein